MVHPLNIYALLMVAYKKVETNEVPVFMLMWFFIFLFIEKQEKESSLLYSTKLPLWGDNKSHFGRQQNIILFIFCIMLLYSTKLPENNNKTKKQPKQENDRYCKNDNEVINDININDKSPENFKKKESKVEIKSIRLTQIKKQIKTGQHA